jgi:hypothetical protein
MPLFFFFEIHFKIFYGYPQKAETLTMEFTGMLVVLLMGPADG